ncbi:MAG: hypothetical protein V1734_00670 [Nanoarchaeota archaeon]
MRKILIAVLCAVILLVSIAAAQVALPTKAVQATDANIAKNVAPAVQANAFGLKADKNQCMCSADTLAKIAQIKKLLAELEQSCMIVENPGINNDNNGQNNGQPVQADLTQPTYELCVAKCSAEQRDSYCTPTCANQADPNECYQGCAAGVEQKCKNSCSNAPKEKPQQLGCIDTCMAKNYDKAGCLGGCSQEDINNDGPCYKSCQNKANEVYGMCQKQCVGQETTSTQASEVLGQCSSSCEVKYGDCKNSCYVNAGTDFKAAEDCTVNQCMPILKQCSTSCNSQYAPKQTFVQKVVNVFKPAQFRNAKWICHDGTESVEGGDTSCKPSETWSGYAKQACEGKCSTATNKCGVNTFMVYNEC